jgi:sulfite exporter TauE/SafE
MEHLVSQMPFIFGLIAAVFHVLTGPDHLAAVGPIAIKSQLRSWIVGVSWGLGHIVGMLSIGVLFYFFRELIPIDGISAHSEQIVGILLVSIGIWTFWRFKKENDKHRHVHLHQSQEGNYFVHTHNHDHQTRAEHKHFNTQDRQNVLISLGIGLVHGFAGVSHIISLLPTLAFAKAEDSVLYLIGFAAGTIVAMVFFASILGFVGKYSSEQRKRISSVVINLTAGFAAIFVGFFWIWESWMH